MSDQPMGPGWWQASDGRWYPPQPPPQQWPPPAPSFEPPTPVRRARWPWVVGAALVVMLVVAAVAAAVGAGNKAKSSASAVTTTTTFPPITVPDLNGPAPTDPPDTDPPATDPPATTPAPTPAPQTFSGHGDDVVTFNHPIDGPLLATMSYAGGGNFAIWSASGGQKDDLLVNTIGKYLGERVVSGSDDQLIVEASGPWTAKLDLLDTDRTWSDGQISGVGDSVVTWLGIPGGVAAIHGVGDGNFVVLFNGDLMVNEIGNYDGRVPIDTGPVIVEVEATGPWSITVTSS